MNYSALLNPEHIKSKTTHTVLFPSPCIHLEIFCDFFKRIKIIDRGWISNSRKIQMQTGGGRWCWTRVKCLGAGVGMCAEDRGEGEGTGWGAGGLWGRGGIRALSELSREQNLPHICPHLPPALEPWSLPANLIPVRRSWDPLGTSLVLVGWVVGPVSGLVYQE